MEVYRKEALVKSEDILSIHSIIRVSKDQISTELVDEVVILDLKTGVYYGLDCVGTRIWKLAQESKPISEIRDLLLAEYDVTPERCECDLLTFLFNLQANGLIETRNECDD